MLPVVQGQKQNCHECDAMRYGQVGSNPKYAVKPSCTKEYTGKGIWKGCVHSSLVHCTINNCYKNKFVTGTNNCKCIKNLELLKFSKKP